MKRTRIGLVVAGLIASLAVATSAATAATPVDGGTCAKAGSTAAVRSTQYVCTASGSKLVWRANAATVRAGRGCTKLAELATVGSAQTLFSCTRAAKTRLLTWKAASKECRDANNLYNQARKQYLDTLAQVTSVETEAKKLSGNDATALLAQVATIKQAVSTLGGLANDMKASIPLACSL